MNHLRVVFFIAWRKLFTSCSTQEPKLVEPQYPTSQCRTYHSMSTAPMAPYAAEALRIKCEESLEVTHHNNTKKPHLKSGASIYSVICVVNH